MSQSSFQTLLQSNQIPFRMAGTQKRIRLADILAFQQEREHRSQIMDDQRMGELVEEIEAPGLDS